LIGDAGATIWQFVAVEDIKETLKMILLFFSIDLCSTVVSSITLWGFCKISLFKAFMALQTEYGSVMCALIGLCVLTVSMESFKNDLNF
jgi:hypothetical protein